MEKEEALQQLLLVMRSLTENGVVKWRSTSGCLRADLTLILQETELINEQHRWSKTAYSAVLWNTKDGATEVTFPEYVTEGYVVESLARIVASNDRPELAQNTSIKN
jgi:hypothetical protein